MPQTHPRRAVDLSPRALLAAGVTGVLAVDFGALESGQWSLATRAEDLSPSAVQTHKAGDRGIVAVVSVRGPIEQRSTGHDLCGGITEGYDTIEARFAAAVDKVKEAGRGKVLLDIDSPGGVTTSMVSTARRMRAYADRAGVRVESVATEQMTSAALAIGLVADRLHVPTHGLTASIGVGLVRRPSSDAQGVEIFRSGDRKMRPNTIEPLNADDRADIQERIDTQARDFARWVADRRGKDADYWLSLKGAALSGEAALKAGLVDSNATAIEVIDMALKDAEQAEIAEAVGLSASASFVEIKAKMTEMRGAAGELAAAREAQARAEREKMALEESIARQARETEAQTKRSAFVSEVKTACSSGLITPPRESALIAFYDKHGEAAARDALGEVKADKPIVRTDKVGAAPETSNAVDSDPMSRMTAEDREHCKRRGFDERTYAERKYGMAEVK